TPTRSSWSTAAASSSAAPTPSCSPPAGSTPSSCAPSSSATPPPSPADPRPDPPRPDRPRPRLGLPHPGVAGAADRTTLWTDVQFCGADRHTGERVDPPPAVAPPGRDRAEARRRRGGGAARGRLRRAHGAQRRPTGRRRTGDRVQLLHLPGAPRHRGVLAPPGRAAPDPARPPALAARPRRGDHDRPRAARRGRARARRGVHRRHALERPRRRDAARPDRCGDAPPPLGGARRRPRPRRAPHPRVPDLRRAGPRGQRPPVVRRPARPPRPLGRARHGGGAMSTDTTAPDLVYDPYAYEIHEDPYPTYARLREEAPLYRNEAMGFWALSHHRDVMDAFRDNERFSSAHGVSLDPAASGPNAHRTMSFLAMDPPMHGRMRGLVSRGFTPR